MENENIKCCRCLRTLDQISIDPKSLALIQDYDQLMETIYLSDHPRRASICLECKRTLIKWLMVTPYDSHTDSYNEPAS